MGSITITRGRGPLQRRRVIGGGWRHHGGTWWNQSWTMTMAILLVLWTSGTFHHGIPTSTTTCSSPSWWLQGVPVACAQYARGRARLRTASTSEEEEEEDANATIPGMVLGANAAQNERHAIEQQQQQHQQQHQQRENRRPRTLAQIFAKAGNKALGGGIPGMVAGVVQVLSLMWLRTIINYQCRYGTNFREAWMTLYKDGGIARFYKGMGFALLQTPLSRFGSTAANDGVEAMIRGLRLTRSWGPARSTVLAALVVGMWRIAIMPLDTCKTVLQVDSAQGFAVLWRKVRAGNIGVLYQGAAAMAVAAMVGHYPWFYTYNALSRNEWIQSLISSALLRNALIGVTASVVSDAAVNSLRVIKTMKQTMGTKHHGGLGYIDTVRLVLATDGWKGLFGRGLRTRILANGLQSLVFTVIWRGLAEYWIMRKSSSEDRVPTGNQS